MDRTDWRPAGRLLRYARAGSVQRADTGDLLLVGSRFQQRGRRHLQCFFDRLGYDRPGRRPVVCGALQPRPQNLLGPQRNHYRRIRHRLGPDLHHVLLGTGHVLRRGSLQLHEDSLRGPRYGRHRQDRKIHGVRAGTHQGPLHRRGQGAPGLDDVHPVRLFRAGQRQTGSRHALQHGNHAASFPRRIRGGHRAGSPGGHPEPAGQIQRRSRQLGTSKQGRGPHAVASALHARESLGRGGKRGPRAHEHGLYADARVHADL